MKLFEDLGQLPEGEEVVILWRDCSGFHCSVAVHENSDLWIQDERGEFTELFSELPESVLCAFITREDYNKVTHLEFSEKLPF